MSLIRQIDQDLAAAMKQGDAAKTAVLRLLKSSFKNEQIKLGHELSDEEATKVLSREAKQRKDSVEAYTQAGRQDLVDAEASELKIIQSYMPEQMGDDQLRPIVQKVIQGSGASGPQQMGMVIGAVMKQVASQADGGDVARIVKEELSS